MRPEELPPVETPRGPLPTPEQLTARYGPTTYDQPPGSNDVQAQRAADILEAWDEGEDLTGPIPDYDAVDLICAVLHWVTKTGFDADDVMKQARWHFVREVGEGYSEH